MTLPQKEASSIGVAMEIPIEVKEEAEQVAREFVEWPLELLKDLLKPSPASKLALFLS